MSRTESIADRSRSPAWMVARRRWWLIALTTGLALLVAIAGLSLLPARYTATATLQAPIATGVQTPTDLTYLDRLMNTYTELVNEPGFRAAVAARLGSHTTPSLSVTVEANTELLQLSASDRSPEVALRTADAAAGTLVDRAAALAQGSSKAGEDELASQLDVLSSSITSLKLALAQTPDGRRYVHKRLVLEQEISGDETSYDALAQQRAQLQVADATRNQALGIVQPAALPTSPSFPRWPPVLALALGLGLLGGLALAFVLERLAPRLYTFDAIESAAEVEVLAAIPHLNRKVASSSEDRSAAAEEAFGMLAVQLLAEASTRPLQTVLVTSRRQGDGKSTVAANLALELARVGRQVALVDGDLRSPTLHRLFETSRSPGLSNLLESAEPTFALEEFVHHPFEHLDLGVIPAGAEPRAPVRLLASERLTGLLFALTDQNDFVILDAPPLVVSDALSIARLADHVLLVVGGDAMPDRDLKMATRDLQAIGANHVSVVANRWRGAEVEYGYAQAGREGR